MSSAPSEDQYGTPTAPKKFPPELEPYVRECQAFIDAYRTAMTVAAGGVALRFEPGNGFMINFESKVVTLDVKDWQWAEEKKVNRTQILWSVLHELSHFHDLQENAKGMLENFDDLHAKAKTLAPKVIELWTAREGGTLPEYLTAEAIEKFVYKQLHEIANCLDDMYVNSGLGVRHPAFAAEGSASDEVRSLYAGVLFPADHEHRGDAGQPGDRIDYTHLPSCKQLAYKLLRERMVPDQPVLVQPEVTKALREGTSRIRTSAGKTRASVAETLTRWSSDGVQRDPRARFLKLDEQYGPIIEKFFLQDVEKLPIPPPPPPPGEGGEGEPGEGEGEPGEGEPKDGKPGKPGKKGKPGKGTPSPWDPLDDRPDPLMDEDAVRKFVEAKDAAEKGTDEAEAIRRKFEQLTPQERADAQSAKRLAKQLTSDEVSPEQALRSAEEYLALRRQVEPLVADLAAVFEEFMQSIDEQLQGAWARWQIRGRFRADDFLRTYASELAAGMEALIPWDALPVHQQREWLRQVTLFPNRIRVRLLIDCSGSMFHVSERMAQAKALTVLITEALAAFEGTVNRRFPGAQPFEVDTQIIAFGSKGNVEVVKHLRGQGPVQTIDEQAQRVRALGGLVDRGMTCDAAAWGEVLDTVSDEDRAAIRSGRLVDIAFEVTDGGSNEAAGLRDVSLETELEKELGAGPVETRTLVAEVAEAGIVARGFQVGHAVTDDDDDVRAFCGVWGDGGECIEGAVDLAPAVERQLAGVIQRLRIKVVEMGGDPEADG